MITPEPIPCAIGRRQQCRTPAAPHDEGDVQGHLGQSQHRGKSCHSAAGSHTIITRRRDTTCPKGDARLAGYCWRGSIHAGGTCGSASECALSHASASSAGLPLQAKLLNHGTVQGFFTTFDVLTLCATTEALPRTARRHKRLCPSNQDRLSTLELHQSTPWRQPPACPLTPHTSFALVRVVARRLLRVRVVARASSPKHTMTKVLSKTTKSSHEYRDSA